MLSAKPKVEANNSYLVRCRCCSQTPFNTDTEGTTESVPINGESVLSGSCY